MRVLVAGLYREPSGYGRAAQDLILALDEAGADVACRPVQLTHNQQTNHPRIRELERKSFPGRSDVLFQHCPPYLMQYCGRGGLNIGSFYTETSPLPLNWVSHASLLDMQVVPTQLMRDTLLESPHYHKPAVVVPLPCDASKYERQFDAPENVRDFGRGRFLFYTVGEWVKRKNTSGLLKAFFAEFKSWEPVGLVIKTGIAGQTAAQVQQTVLNEIDLVRKGTKLATTAPVMLITERLTDDELMGLHQACDVFVQPSCGEAWSIPAFDALGFGKTPIVTMDGGYREYVDDSVGWLTPGRREPVFGEGEVHAELFTGRQTWMAPDLLALQQQMRQAYEDAELRTAKAARGLDRVKMFSHANVGQQLLKVFRDGQQALRKSTPSQIIRLG